MLVYVVVSVCSGCVAEVKGFLDASDAEAEAASLRQDLGIGLGHEEESEHSVQIHEVDVEV